MKLVRLLEQYFSGWGWHKNWLIQNVHLSKEVTLRPRYYHTMFVPATTSSTRCCHSSGTVSPITYSSPAPYVARSTFRISLNALHRMSVNYQRRRTKGR